MLYVVGDSNSVYTSPYLLGRPMDNTSLCRIGWTTNDVLDAIDMKGNLPNATTSFVFVGLNDRLTGQDIATNILAIVAALQIRSSQATIFVAPPFCVNVSTPEALCTHRSRAAQIVFNTLRTNGMGSILVIPHLTKTMHSKKNTHALKQGSTNVDPLHLNMTAYMNIANVINEYIKTHPPCTFTNKRSHKAPTVYEAEPAPSPRVAWANARKAYSAQLRPL